MACRITIAHFIGVLGLLSIRSGVEAWPSSFGRFEMGDARGSAGSDHASLMPLSGQQPTLQHQKQQQQPDHQKYEVLTSPISLSSSQSLSTSELANKIASWLSQAPHNPATQYSTSCTDHAIASWTDRCDALSGNQQRQRELSALLTVCQHQKSSRSSVPTECTMWLSGQGQVDACIE